MDKKECISFLKEKVKEIPGLYNLSPEDKNFSIWCKTIEGILLKNFNNDSFEYKTFVEAGKVHGFIEDRYTEHRKAVQKRETALVSIINTLDTIGEEGIQDNGKPLRVFISHGHSEGALSKLETFIREFGIEPIIVKKQPNADRTVDDKVLDYLKDVDFVIIFATGDDKVVKIVKGNEEITWQPRQNVIHETGLAQQSHIGKIIYLLEGKAQFPSNIAPKVHYKFERHSMDEAFTGIVREMRNWGFLKAEKSGATHDPI